MRDLQLTRRVTVYCVFAMLCLAISACTVKVERVPAQGDGQQSQNQTTQNQQTQDQQAQNQDVELQMGQEVFNQLKAKGEIIESSPLYDQLKPIADAITKAAQHRYDHPFKFYLVHETQPNAFATPGGNVYVVDSLLHFVKSKEQLAGTLCHEVSHTIHHDTVELMEKRSSRILRTAIQTRFLSFYQTIPTTRTESMRWNTISVRILRSSRSLIRIRSQHRRWLLLTMRRRCFCIERD